MRFFLSEIGLQVRKCESGRQAFYARKRTNWKYNAKVIFVCFISEISLRIAFECDICGLDIANSFHNKSPTSAVCFTHNNTPLLHNGSCSGTFHFELYGRPASPLKMEAVYSSETLLATYQPARCPDPEANMYVFYLSIINFHAIQE